MALFNFKRQKSDKQNQILNHTSSGVQELGISTNEAAEYLTPVTILSAQQPVLGQTSSIKHEVSNMADMSMPQLKKEQRDISGLLRRGTTKYNKIKSALKRSNKEGSEKSSAGDRVSFRSEGISSVKSVDGRKNWQSEDRSSGGYEARSSIGVISDSRGSGYSGASNGIDGAEQRFEGYHTVNALRNSKGSGGATRSGRGLDEVSRGPSPIMEDHLVTDIGIDESYRKRPDFHHEPKSMFEDENMQRNPFLLPIEDLVTSYRDAIGKHPFEIEYAEKQVLSELEVQRQSDMEITAHLIGIEAKILAKKQQEWNERKRRDIAREVEEEDIRTKQREQLRLLKIAERAREERRAAEEEARERAEKERRNNEERQRKLREQHNAELREERRKAKLGEQEAAKRISHMSASTTWTGIMKSANKVSVPERQHEKITLATSRTNHQTRSLLGNTANSRKPLPISTSILTERPLFKQSESTMPIAISPPRQFTPTPPPSKSKIKNLLRLGPSESSTLLTSGKNSNSSRGINISDPIPEEYYNTTSRYPQEERPSFVSSTALRQESPRVLQENVDRIKKFQSRPSQDETYQFSTPPDRPRIHQDGFTASPRQQIWSEDSVPRTGTWPRQTEPSGRDTPVANTSFSPVEARPLKSSTWPKNQNAGKHKGQLPLIHRGSDGKFLMMETPTDLQSSNEADPMSYEENLVLDSFANVPPPPINAKSPRRPKPVERKDLVEFSSISPRASDMPSPLRISKESHRSDAEEDEMGDSGVAQSPPRNYRAISPPPNHHQYDRRERNSERYKRERSPTSPFSAARPRRSASPSRYSSTKAYDTLGISPPSFRDSGERRRPLDQSSDEYYLRSVRQ